MARAPMPTPPIANLVSLRKHRYGCDPSRYPIKSVAYVISHTSLWRIVFKVACCGSILAVIILIVLLATALKPQAKLISPNLEWWGWLIGVLVVFVEAAICATLLIVVSQSKAQTKVFVETMRIEGYWRENEMKPQSTIKDLNLLKKAFVVRIVTLPIQIVPLLGGAVYSAINATFTGWDYMDRYFDAISLPPKLQRVEVFGEDRSDCLALLHPATYDSDNDYARFGFMCGFMESLPIVGWVLFPVTNAVAAALFACDIEKSGGPAALEILKSHPSQSAGISPVAAAMGLGRCEVDSYHE
mmetsp:Transcript_27440/g.57354  ORF Transcript_27440/g.57354 Transcript_27440/m.57354 type:complete len:300 (+) Transcript_27440:47-946(+)